MATGHPVRRAWSTLPTGDALSTESWRARHAWICRLLWAHALLLPLYGLSQGLSPTHAVSEGSVLIAGLALAASSPRLGVPLRSLVATLGLVASSAVLVHFSGGLVEMHFHFFVVVVVVSLYQSWRPFLVALGVVILHHGVAGMIDPAAVYNHPAALANPWGWALVHGLFITAASSACVVAWRLNEESLRRERDALDELAAAQRVAAVGSWEWDLRTGEVSWSTELFRILGLTPRPSVTLGTFLGQIHPEERQRVGSLVKAARASGSNLDFECRSPRVDGPTRQLHVLGHLVRDDAGAPAKLIGTCQDVTDRKALEQEITHRAFYDGLTGLANRALFLDRLDHALAVRERTQSTTAVLYLDLDGFKAINDALGHRTGDELLVEVARRLRTTARESDTVARLAGDEFAVLLENTEIMGACATAERLVASVAEPVDLGGRRLSVTASIGVGDTAHATDSDELLHHADLAMYTAKRHARGGYEVFHPDMADLSGRQAILKSELRDAVDQGQLVLHYQPIVDLGTETTESVEALVRWDHPRFGLLSPAEFITLAEQTGHIVALGSWVTGEAARQAVELQDRLGRPVHVSVNVAAQQLDDDLVGMVRIALARSGLPPEQLTLELTETSLMSRRASAVAKLQSLRNLGVRIAVDDFGTGYSSLAYLKELPVDVLKIDRAFIRLIAESPEEAGLAHAIIKLAGIFGLRTVAEGVETAEQARTLTELGCHYAQGFLYSRPVPGDDLLIDDGWTRSFPPSPAVATTTQAATPAARQPAGATSAA